MLIAAQCLIYRIVATATAMQHRVWLDEPARESARRLGTVDGSLLHTPRRIVESMQDRRQKPEVRMSFTPCAERLRMKQALGRAACGLAHGRAHVRKRLEEHRENYTHNHLQEKAEALAEALHDGQGALAGVRVGTLLASSRRRMTRCCLRAAIPRPLTTTETRNAVPMR
ncbi:hypothetical protein SPRG_20472 [Saprolegnia parasitica CBS 223.65]|uniref:Uncharacterized protein n=1 Tax=Saprolegnia parasitica (strain CBS 223.65) TaxID=695850 RepID=A0A067C865_SAPPC|nr:hypothetical protein SPRG_20472 [Saprolegnia parasitica CBS 223.65]KDO26668.1 hypothetical protein SPRG_20472 [Saprolegnia parasitica CBS 223.65]|eukprot:XP_012202566.1 hypothetical protein SPRG_20472 [Saprolegnia parasitica CBS 223.65]